LQQVHLTFWSLFGLYTSKKHSINYFRLQYTIAGCSKCIGLLCAEKRSSIVIFQKALEIIKEALKYSLQLQEIITLSLTKSRSRMAAGFLYLPPIFLPLSGTDLVRGQN